MSLIRIDKTKPAKLTTVKTVKTLTARVIKSASIWVESVNGNIILHVGFDRDGIEDHIEYMIPNLANLDLELLTQKAKDFVHELLLKNVELQNAVVALDAPLVQHEYFEFPHLAKKEIVRTRDSSIAELYPKYPYDYATVLNDKSDKTTIKEDVYLLKKNEYGKLTFFIKQAGIKITRVVLLEEALTGKNFNDSSIIIAIENKNTLVMVKKDHDVKAYIPLNTGYAVFRERTIDAQEYFKVLDELYDRCSYLLPVEAKVYIYLDKEKNSLEKQMLSNANFPANYIIEDTTFHKLILALDKPKVAFPMEIQN